jgi:hypothetical protein
MAAGYSDEVASILWTDHGYRGQIGVLRDGWVERLPAAGERRA